MFGAMANTAVSSENPTVRSFALYVATAYNGLLSPKFEEYLEQRDTAANRVLAGEYWMMARGERGQKIIEEFYDTCRKGGSNAHICDTIMGPVLNASVTDSASRICTNNPDLGGCEIPQKETVDVNEVINNFKNQLANMNGVTQESLQTLHYIGETLGQNQQEVFDWVRDEKKKQEAEKIAAEVRAKHEKIIKNAQATVSTVSTIALLYRLWNFYLVKSNTKIIFANLFNELKNI